MDSKKLALLCRKLAENKKAENAVILDVRKLSSVTDYFVIVSGTSEPHLRAIVNEVIDNCARTINLRPRAVEGDAGAAWQVLDYFDVIVHVMRADVAGEIRPWRACGATLHASAQERPENARPKTTPERA